MNDLYVNEFVLKGHFYFMLCPRHTPVLFVAEVRKHTTYPAREAACARSIFRSGWWTC